ncbi:hypothetical protein EI427_22795 [Flammeovirga pectinis]|uniref:DUF4374 domain-containing protein n=1 Tax=Flammeovirga pectinis TaxID=2494373 RepID=A0A3Q9FSN6_9BACT|nr:hypothetical protein [Flammeovirga pectinis]AZQ65052.1 hypothetical protein EI427_22795 [Flammeovirga pectinis]
MKFYQSNILIKLFSLITLFTFAGCNNDDTTNETPIDPTEKVFNIAADVSTTDAAMVYMAPTNSLTEGDFSIVDNGTEMKGERSAYLAEANGLIYNLNYGTGVIRELEYDGKSSYNQLTEISVQQFVGTHPRFEVVSNESLLAFYVATSEPNTQNEVEVTLQIVKMKIPGLQIEETEEVSLGTYAENDAYVSRVDAPVVMNGKVYFGTQQKINGNPDGYADDLATIVLDYPSFENYSIVHSSQSKGHNYGYRGRSMYEYQNAVYQVNWPVDGADVVFTKLVDGDYDNSYSFNVTETLGGGSFGSVNWFHIGGGKGYVAIEDKSIDDDNNWYLARVDVINKTIEKVEGIPYSDLFKYQNAVVEGEKFYMAISPNGGESFVYEIENTTAAQGLQLDGGNVYVQGIY